MTNLIQTQICDLLKFQIKSR